MIILYLRQAMKSNDATEFPMMHPVTAIPFVLWA